MCTTAALPFPLRDWLRDAALRTTLERATAAVEHSVEADRMPEIALAVHRLETL